jgi:tripartite-type tricarboxylate transporter receptor subunit TctC
VKKLLSVLLFASGSALAQAYPDHPVRIIVGYPPGGGTDLVARLIQQPLSTRWGQPVVIDNRPGANAIIAAEAVAKAKPGTLSYSSSGSGSVHHFAGELFKLQTGADILHVPYKGSGPATADAVSGQVQVTYASAASVLRFVQAGRLRALAVTSKKRSPQMPEVPSMTEAGLADFELTSWYGLLAPAGTPPAVIAKIHADASAALAAPEMQKSFAAQGLDPAGGTPQSFGEFIRAESAKFARIAKAGNIRAE